MSEAPSTLAVEGEAYFPRTPDPSDFTVTPANLRLEIEALKEGWSRNRWVRLNGRGHELLLWRRDLANAPPVTLRVERDPQTRVSAFQVEGAGGRFHHTDPAYLARFMWSFDPARYDQPTPAPAAPGGVWARMRSAWDSLWPTWTEGAVSRPVLPPLNRWSVLDEGGPLDGFDAVRLPP
jgi:hypothetical protein